MQLIGPFGFALDVNRMRTRCMHARVWVCVVYMLKMAFGSQQLYTVSNEFCIMCD